VMSSQQDGALTIGDVLGSFVCFRQRPFALPTPLTAPTVTRPTQLHTWALL
jgi:hypothetical protein